MRKRTSAALETNRTPPFVRVNWAPKLEEETRPGLTLDALGPNKSDLERLSSNVFWIVRIVWLPRGNVPGEPAFDGHQRRLARTPGKYKGRWNSLEKREEILCEYLDGHEVHIFPERLYLTIPHSSVTLAKNAETP